MTIPEGFIAVAARSGKRVHLARPGSSRTQCGWWLRFQAVHAKQDRPVTCRHCIESLRGTEAFHLVQATGATPMANKPYGGRP